jgi:hypothetical protein
VKDFAGFFIDIYVVILPVITMAAARSSARLCRSRFKLN